MFASLEYTSRLTLCCEWYICTIGTFYIVLYPWRKNKSSAPAPPALPDETHINNMDDEKIAKLLRMQGFSSVDGSRQHSSVSAASASELSSLDDEEIQRRAAQRYALDGSDATSTTRGTPQPRIQPRGVASGAKKLTQGRVLGERAQRDDNAGRVGDALQGYIAAADALAVASQKLVQGSTKQLEASRLCAAYIKRAETLKVSISGGASKSSTFTLPPRLKSILTQAVQADQAGSLNDALRLYRVGLQGLLQLRSHFAAEGNVDHEATCKGIVLRYMQRAELLSDTLRHSSARAAAAVTTGQQQQQQQLPLATDVVEIFPGKS